MGLAHNPLPQFAMEKQEMGGVGFKMTFVLFAALVSLALEPMPSQATEDGAQEIAQRVVLTLGREGDRKRLFHPDRLTFEAGKRYTLVIDNPSLEVHEFDAPSFMAAVGSSRVKVLNDIGESAYPVAKIVGKPAEIEVFPGSSVEWTFVPGVVGKYDMLCDIQTQSGKTHTEIGMKGIIVVR
jgi:uncharacterized cupredoxin-like copper-binding protein